MPSQVLFGVPERESTLVLEKTTYGEPYRMFATDEPFHKPENPQPLYGNIPYVTGINEDSAAAILWINSADTYAEVDFESF